jgi:8-hydroxy-5-deazaflavin:NADPH oxidoreductase
MNITIIGAGNMGRGIATRLLSGGYSITLVDRDEAQAAKLAQQLSPAAQGAATVTAAHAGSPITGEIVVLAVYYLSAPAIIEQYGDQLADKVIVDIANPLNATFDGLATSPDSSAAEELAKIAPAGAKVVKAFNTTFAGTLIAGQVAGQPLDVFIAGDNAEAKALLAGVVQASGMRPVDVGPLRRARQLEGIGLLHITLQGTLGTNWMSTIKILS